MATQTKEKPKIHLQEVLASYAESGASSAGRATAEIRARKDPSCAMKMLKGDAVANIASGTYSSIILLVTTRVIPAPKPETSLLKKSSQNSMNYVITAPTVKTAPVSRSELRRPIGKIALAERAPMQAPMLKMPLRDWMPMSS